MSEDCRIKKGVSDGVKGLPKKYNENPTGDWVRDSADGKMDWVRQCMRDCVMASVSNHRRL